MSLSSIKTRAGYRFHLTGQAEKGQKLFTVTPNLPAADVLQSISCLLSAAEEPIYEAAMGEREFEGNIAWLVLHTLQSAEAALDAVIDSISDAENAQEADQ